MLTNISRYLSQKFLKFCTSSKSTPQSPPVSVNNNVTRIVTGIQPTGSLTVGNYLGSIDNLIRIQNTHP